MKLNRYSIVIACFIGQVCVYTILVPRNTSATYLPYKRTNDLEITQLVPPLLDRGKLLDSLTNLKRNFHKDNVPLLLQIKLDGIIESVKMDKELGGNNQTLCVGSKCSRKLRDTNTSELLEVCPESWEGEDRVYFLDFWKTENCSNALPFKTIMSVLLYPSRANSNSCYTQVENVLTGIQKVYGDLPVLVAYTKGFCKVASRSNTASHVRYVSVNGKAPSPGRVWNTLVDLVKTPYVLIGKDLDYFMWFSDLKRPVRILSQSRTIRVVGGAFRNWTGHWQVGCYQSSLRNYILEYQDGYYSSKNSCMFCDHLVGPFVAKTDFLRENPFHGTLPKRVLFEDYFLKLSQLYHSVVNCPDVMYFASDPMLDTKLKKRRLWLPLVRKWELNRIVVPNKRVFRYSCSESKIECNKFKASDSVLIPICCIKESVKDAVTMDEFCRRHKIPYELDGETVMGIVRMGDVMPWNHDDIRFLGNFTVFSEHHKDFKNAKFPSGKVKFVSNEYLWGNSTSDANTSDGLPVTYDSMEGKMFREFPTQAQLHGHWMYVMPNPGGHSRNCYGYETLKHTSYFRSFNRQKEMPYQECGKPMHHACIHRFETDGSLQFLVPN